ncbi:hypothetical protein BCR35DRAFT_308105 [Leucosporidium creatinivorum]|uniref:HMG box domain-containing protein n=1 Tax=Leucosporidium creatinivorum TaxID=106004 RepID=A0A1Y2ECM9_9BASI|nr:hypothetical protein BCR35DRAFT_308105 [Leucosporidium creatinivorum]
MADAKQKVIAAYVELAQVLTKASVAITDYATAINVASEPANIAHLVANPPLLPFFGASAAGALKADSDEEVGDGKKRKREKKAKKVKDPNAPKRPASAYLEFQNAVRAQFREADPALPYSEVLRKIADTWSHMSVDDKKHWNDITAAKTVEWEAAKAAYHPAEGAADIPVASAASGSTTTVGKDGKEYTGKKRGRKSNAEKAALAAAGGDAGVLQALAAEPSKKKSKKEEKEKVVVKAPSSDEDEDDSSDESSSDEDDSDDDSDEEEEEEVPAPKPSKSNGKKESKSEKPKSKKSKTA